MAILSVLAGVSQEPKTSSPLQKRLMRDGKKLHKQTVKLQIWKKKIETIPFVRLLNLKLISLDEDGLVMRVKVVPKLLNFMGGVHGGGISSLIDTAVYFAIRPFVPGEKVLSTTELKINFFRAAGKGSLEARSRILHLGKRTAVGEAEVVDEKGRLVAKGTAGHLIA